MSIETRQGPPRAPRWDICIIYTAADGMVYSSDHAVSAGDAQRRILHFEEEVVGEEARLAAMGIIRLRGIDSQ